MKYNTVLALATGLVTSFVSAQQYTLPNCGFDAVTQNLNKAGCPSQPPYSNIDYACLCKSTFFLENFNNYVTQLCPATSYQATSDAIESICLQQAQVTISVTIQATSAPTSGSSAPTTAPTTAPATTVTEAVTETTTEVSSKPPTTAPSSTVTTRPSGNSTVTTGGSSPTGTGGSAAGRNTVALSAVIAAFVLAAALV